jgi:hypothetical protein
MPRAGDAFLNGGLNATHSPLQRIGYQATKKPLSFDDILQQIEDFVTTYLFPAIKSLTGIDLTTLLPLLNAFKAFMDGVTGVLSGNPTAFLGALNSIFGGGPTAWFADLLGLFGNPAGLGTGSASLPSLSNIPILGPIFGLFGASNATQAGNVFTNLFGLFSNPSLTSSPGSFNPATALFTGPVTEIRSLINSLTGGTSNPLSSLISNLLGTASTASTANTNANTGLSNWSTLLAGLPGISTISQLISWLSPGSSGSGIFATLINGVAGGTTNPLSSLISSLTGTASTASTASTTSSTNASNITSLISNLFGGSSILSQVQPGAVGGVTSGASLLTDVQTFLNNIFGGITKNTNTTTSQGDALDAVSSQSNTVITTAGTMQQILAALGTGTPDSDDFERTSSSNLGANWNQQQTGTGVLATPNGHDASSTGTGSSYEFTARKTNKVASTDHQTSTIVLASAFPSYPFFTPLPYGGYIDVWVRMSAFTTFATRTGLRFRVNGNPPYQATWTIDWVNSGTVTNLASGTLPSIPGAAASIAFEVGVGGNNLAYQGRVNGTPVANFTDSTTRGLGNTGRGFGGKGNSGVGTNQGVPSVQQWTAQG